MKRRQFLQNLAGIGLFTILPGAGRIWKASTPRIQEYEFFIENPCPGLPLDMQHVFKIVYCLKQQREQESGIYAVDKIIGRWVRHPANGIHFESLT